MRSSFIESRAITEIQNKNHLSIKSVLRALGLSERSGTNYARIYQVAHDNSLDTSHWKGRAHAKGRMISCHYKTALEAMSSWSTISSNTLKLKLFKDGLKEKRCEVCGIEQWRGQPAPLELHHQDGRRLHNTLDNLQILCANCHAQTSTYCGKNITLRGRKRN